ncbi:MAG: molybdopterin-guanine dinucleotide biosynthesis protein B [Deltaproteobacteria bacterium]|nr:MAG: molybdopterin-guanine dinucleotide biosynthesis protein B [Deltaproteobacteria bacterium]
MDPPVICIVGSSGAGKTTLLEKLIPELTRWGLKVGTIKHDVHGFEIDKPGKDSYRLKHSGAVLSIISSPARVAVVMDTEHDLGLAELLPFYSGVDIVLTEGYKRENYPKIEVFRKEVHPEPLCLGDSNLIAMVTDEPLNLGIPRFGPHQVNDLADFLMAQFLEQKNRPRE